MSNWVYVSGSIHLESFILMQNKEEVFKDIETCFGKTTEYNPNGPYYAMCHYDACGIESFLCLNILYNEKQNPLDYNVVIYGDLKDFTDTQYIIDWIKQSVVKSDIWWMRSCVVKIETNGQTIVMYNMDDNLEIIHLNSEVMFC